MAKKITASNAKVSQTRASFDVHISGGLKAIPVGSGRFVVTPSEGEPARGLLFPSMRHLTAEIATQPIVIIGVNEYGPSEGYLRHSIWRPLNVDGSSRVIEADIWGSVAVNADEQGEARVAELARSVSFSMRAAGIRLRDASNHYHNQLRQALKDSRPTGNRFSNVALYDLHLAFHSVAAELASARDYLATLIGISHGAPEKIDSMARLSDWLSKAAQKGLAKNTLIKGIIDAQNIEKSDPWLAHLSALRNLFTHKKPIRSSARFLKVAEFNLANTPMHYLTLMIELPDRERDAIREFIDLHNKLSDLSLVIADSLPYSQSPPHVVMGS